MTGAAYGVEEKNNSLRMHREKQRELSAHIEKVVCHAKGEQGVGGCTAGLCGWVRRRLAARRAEALEAGSVRDAVDAVSASAATHSNLEMHRAVFGLAGAKRADPAAKLDEAAQVMRARIAQLEERASEGKAEAAKLMKAGQKTQALRALKKAKAVEAQAEANQSSLMAVEQQVDMLAQAAMQKTLASALATTSKIMKKDSKVLGKAEAAIDDATEARDMASDLNTVMAEFAATGAGGMDEDALMAELESMMEDGAAPSPPADAQAAERARQAEIADHEAKLAARKADREHNKAVRSAVEAMPSAPTVRSARREEKAGLLAKGVA